jgi:hypothetical protein
LADEPGVHDFDFLTGRWSVKSRRLKERLAGCDVEFDATLTAWPLLDGYANGDSSGSRRSPWTAAAPGRRTGSWTRIPGDAEPQAGVRRGDAVT